MQNLQEQQQSDNNNNQQLSKQLQQEVCKICGPDCRGLCEGLPPRDEQILDIEHDLKVLRDISRHLDIDLTAEQCGLCMSARCTCGKKPKKQGAFDSWKNREEGGTKKESKKKDSAAKSQYVPIGGGDDDDVPKKKGFLSSMFGKK